MCGEVTPVHCLVTALARDAGTLADLDGARALRTEIRAAGVTSAEAVLALHHVVLGEQDKSAPPSTGCAGSPRGDYAYYADIAHCMASLPVAAPSPTTWLDGPDAVRTRWRQLAQDRQIRISEDR
ncbi:hypothetical protein ACFY7H_01280 [Streptomyces sp. NPDC012794]|uniref:hypothetical protein n=1 Tax=Streptomyces sp. NPDC012794 TaxID=3364850 RepID=UPI0036BEBC83